MTEVDVEVPYNSIHQANSPQSVDLSLSSDEHDANASQNQTRKRMFYRIISMYIISVNIAKVIWRIQVLLTKNHLYTTCHFAVISLNWHDYMAYIDVLHQAITRSALTCICVLHRHTCIHLYYRLTVILSTSMVITNHVS